MLNNFRHHAGQNLGRDWIDADCTSAAHFDGWRWTIRDMRFQPRGPRPTALATSWLLTIGWRRHGLLAFDEVPGRAPTSPSRQPIPAKHAEASAPGISLPRNA